MKPEHLASLSVADQDKIFQARLLLSQAGYTEPRVVTLLDIKELATQRQRWQRLPLYVSRARDGSLLNIFVRLFLLRQLVAIDDVRRVIEPPQLEDWAKVGLLGINGSEVIGLIELCPYERFIVAADWPDATQAHLNQVMGVAASTQTLAQATIRRHSQATLDLGTGSGILSLLAAAHSNHVVAVDSNPRAIAMAQLNAELNGVINIELREGDLFEPVRGRRFDLIVCNPPFVIAPEQIYLHSHSDMPLDRFCETVVRTAPGFLAEGGYCQIVCNWVQPVGGNGQERLASWFDRSGCDAWILHSHSEDAANYAIERISNLPLSAEQRQKRFDSWMRYYEKEQVDAIGFGLITMRRSSKKSNWFRFDSWPEMLGPCGDAIERGFIARDFLESHNDGELLEARVRCAPNLHWRREHDISDLDCAVQSSLHFTTGLAYTANMDSAIVKFVSRCAGDRPLSDHLREAAELSGEDPTRFGPRFLRVLRGLVERGFLTPVKPD